MFINSGMKQIQKRGHGTSMHKPHKRNGKLWPTLQMKMFTADSAIFIMSSCIIAITTAHKHGLGSTFRASYILTIASIAEGKIHIWNCYDVMA